MRYLITANGTTPFLTHWFQSENHFNIDLDMIVYDLIENKYTEDGINWIDIEKLSIEELKYAIKLSKEIIKEY